jgi:hypothetical protein
VLGRHRHRIVGDVVEFESTGDFTLTDLARLNELQRQIEQRFDYSLIYVNNIEPGYLAADVRRQAVANNRDPQRRPWSLAMIGVRGAKGLLARAGPAPDRPGHPVGFGSRSAGSPIRNRGRGPRLVGSRAQPPSPGPQPTRLAPAVAPAMGAGGESAPRPTAVPWRPLRHKSTRCQITTTSRSTAPVRAQDRRQYR